MLALLYATTFAAAPQESVTTAQVRAAYHEAFVVVIQPTPTDTFVGALVRSQLSSLNPLAPLVSRAPYLLTYLLQHGTGFQLADLLAGPKNQARLQLSLDSALARDPRFNRLLLPLVAATLAESGRVLIGHTPPTVHTPLAIDSASAIAARFFYPDSFGPDGRLQSRICTGRNGLPPDPSDSELMIEAFVFDALRTPLDKGTFAAIQEYRDTVQSALATLPTSLSLPERLSALRSAAWTRLGHSTVVRTALAERYDSLAPLLPFRLE